MGLFKTFYAVKYDGAGERGVTRFHSKAEAEKFEREMQKKGAKTQLKQGEH